jgi:hypothetical protein
MKNKKWNILLDDAEKSNDFNHLGSYSQPLVSFLLTTPLPPESAQCSGQVLTSYFGYSH